MKLFVPNSALFALKFILFFFLSENVFAQPSTEISLNSSWKFRKVGDTEWLPAMVPGSVHTDLLANKKIPDPFFGANEKDLQWIENEDWEYQTTFDCDKNFLKNKNAEIKFAGLDTYAKVFLNDSLILSADNMFRSWNISCQKILKKENTLKIIFESSVKNGKEEAKKLPYTLPGEERVFTRKAQYQYGWDFAPRFVTCGIWKPIKIFSTEKIRIDNVYVFQQNLSDSLAPLEFEIHYTSFSEEEFDLEIPEGAGRVKRKFKPNKGTSFLTVYTKIHNPKRWWSNGLGEPFLYSFDFSISQNGTILDSKKLKVGLRKIDVVLREDSIGQSFYFKINGVPVFMKGANWVPADVFPSRVSKEKYETLIKAAADAHINMLRVWGGGMYESDEFYDLCDKYGILVWQDLPFACAMYPGDAAFLDNVNHEADENSWRIINHPCLAILCGNNEVDEGWKNWGWQKQFNYSEQDSTKIWNDYEKLFFEKAIPGAPNVLYIPSSPKFGWGRTESLLSGDSHYWGVWWGMEPFEMYKKKIPRFMSEYGFQGMPPLSTFKKFCDEKELSLTSDAVKNHQKHPTGYETIQKYLERDFRQPKDFENYIYVSQLLQAEGMKIAMEAHRRAKPYCMGSLMWQFNDCWPGTSWSMIDYYGNKKAVWYQAKKSFENILLTVEEKNDSLFVFVVSDSLKNFTAEIKVEVIDFTGKIFLGENYRTEISANSSTGCCGFSIKKITSGLRDINQKVFSVSLPYGNEKRTAIHYFVKSKDLLLTKPNIAQKQVSKNVIEISTDVLAKNVFLETENSDSEFSDNFFDLMPGEKKIIFVRNLKGKIKVKSLIDSY